MQRLLLLFLLGAALPGCTDLVQLSVDSADGGDASGTLHAHLYGIDAFIADASATRVATIAREVSGVPAELSLDLPDDLVSLIDEDVRPADPEDASFYFVIYLDSDGDGEVCDGEYWASSFDHAELSWSGPQPPASIELDLDPWDGVGCRAIE